VIPTVRRPGRAGNRSGISGSSESNKDHPPGRSWGCHGAISLDKESARKAPGSFKPFGTPPARQGDYAYLLHIVGSLRSAAKGACILPHGVLFRGNAEADIRRALVRKGYLKGIIGLP
jgi:hypothetical protein